MSNLNNLHTPDPCAQNNLLSLEQALAILRTTLQPIREYEYVDLKAALGRTLAVTVTSLLDLPRERNAAMDGYAFRSQDLHPGQPTFLRQIGIAWAGKPFEETVKPGECIRIFTGSVLPNGADSVIMQEQVQTNPPYIQLPATTNPKQNVREVGEDLHAGDTLLPAGRKLTATDLGLLAATGLANVDVIRPLKIAFFSTGDELINVGAALASGQLYDSNRYLLHGLLTDPCHHLTDLGVLPDNPDVLETLLTQQAAQQDVIISTGGASVGDADHIQTVLARCGEVTFWKIALKPGKPLAFGKIGPCYFFGLPGNPVSAAVTLQQVVKPALQVLCGQTPKAAWRFQATCLQPLKKQPGRIEFQRGILSQAADGTFEVRSVGAQGAHMLSAFSRANCYIVLNAECSNIQAGQPVMVEPF